MAIDDPKEVAYLSDAQAEAVSRAACNPSGFAVSVVKLYEGMYELVGHKDSEPCPDDAVFTALSSEVFKGAYDEIVDSNVGGLCSKCGRPISRKSPQGLCSMCREAIDREVEDVFTAKHPHNPIVNVRCGCGTMTKVHKRKVLAWANGFDHHGSTRFKAKQVVCRFCKNSLRQNNFVDSFTVIDGTFVPRYR